MAAVPLSMAVGAYDHLRDLVNGRVRPEGIELTAMELSVEEIFFRTFSFQEWDIAEFSMAKYVSMLCSGTAPFRAIPVFPSRVFRQSAFYVATASGIRSAEDLAGRRVGIPEWSQTAGIYARSILQHQCNVRLADIHWVQAGVNQAGRNEKVPLSLPEGVTIEAVSNRSLNEMLLAGDLDAIITAREPGSFVAGDAATSGLLAGLPLDGAELYEATSIFPIMHVIVVQQRSLGSRALGLR